MVSAWLFVPINFNVCGQSRRNRGLTHKPFLHIIRCLNQFIILEGGLRYGSEE
jgi:hypothetical protein